MGILTIKNEHLSSEFIHKMAPKLLILRKLGILHNDNKEFSDENSNPSSSI